MKRNISFKIILFVIIAGLTAAMFLYGRYAYRKIQANLTVGEFRVADYQEELEIFSIDKHVGPVRDANAAREKARQIWIEEYGQVHLSEYFGYPKDPSNGSPLQVYYDQTQDCWLIHGTTASAHLIIIELPYAIIRSDGTVLAVWY